MAESLLERGGCTTPTIWPEGLLAGEVSLGSLEDRAWWLIYTQSRQEKMVARNLFAKGVSFYLPLIDRISVSRGRRRAVQVPLFTGYVFLYGTFDERTVALATNRVSTASRVKDGERLRSDLSKVARLIATKAPLSPEARLAQGDWVRVKSGPFVGFEGTVLKRRGKTRLLVAVDYLQQGVSMEIDDFQLENI